MKISPTKISEVLILEPDVYTDERGYFMETFRSSYLNEHGVELNFVQDNQSKSRIGTLRGLHYQLKFPQGKLVRVISGTVFDVAVDIRENSSTFGKWVGETLSAENRKQLWVPPGFAHGFLVLSQSAELFYKCTEYYHPEDDYSLLWNDPAVGIEWPNENREPILSEKDRMARRLSQIPVYSD
ncbi:MAG: dTDP-4-dehydrorhamnose 3,5-epimerase [Gammaproteobacteria bacterium]|nr:dTDP-4-dehydrorhamnose 3,5-epimerase [Gammaproteobacteria bacterium]